ncbi:MAG: hypothetical protein MJE68_19275 [Proteobacteria bacterium]|nr:hypothetical protein [Pseudomonadota bacterium]
MASNVIHRGSSARDQATSTETSADALSNGDLKPCHELHRAVFHGEETRVKELLAIKLNPNAQDRHGKDGEGEL